MTPGYPTNSESLILEEALRGPWREVRFDEHFHIGGLQAKDWFRDGSFYLLNPPGHTVGHLGALAHTTSGAEDAFENTFILIAADACIHISPLRPSQFMPLPDLFSPSPSEPSGSIDPAGRTPGLHECHLPRTGPFFTVADPPVTHGVRAASETIEKLKCLDCQTNVLTVLAHDRHLLEAVDLHPKKANDWYKGGWADSTRWCFERDLLSQNQQLSS